MKTRKTSMFEFMMERHNLWVPLYQRNFSWKEEQFDELFADIKKIVNCNKPHYFGPLVLLCKERSKPRGDYKTRRLFDSYEIIDGQQRITTISLLIEILANKSPDFSSMLAEANFLDSNDIQSKKLDLQFSDDDDLKSIYSSHNISKITNTSLKTCWLTLAKHISGELADDPSFCAKMTSALKMLDVVIIEANGEDDDPQIIFDRINTSGMPLSNFEKLKNYIFLQYNREDQYILSEYFTAAEHLLGSRNDTARFDQFLKWLYCTMYTANIKGSIYNAFHDKIKKFNIKEILNFVEQFAKYSFIFARHIILNQSTYLFINPSENGHTEFLSLFDKSFTSLNISQKLKNLLVHIRSFQFKALYPYILKNLYLLYTGKTEENEITSNLYKSFNSALILLVNKANNLNYNELCLALLSCNPSDIAKNISHPNLARVFDGSRKDMLLLRYFQCYSQDSDIKAAIAHLMRTIDDNDNGEMLTKPLQNAFILMLYSENIELIPTPLVKTISLYHVGLEMAQSAKNRKPYYAMINDCTLEVISWIELKIRSIEIALRTDQALFKRVLDEKVLKLDSKYIFLSVDERAAGENCIRTEVNGEIFYTSTRSQSATDIVRVVSILCTTPNSFVECI